MSESAEPRSGRFFLPPWLEALRPGQWAKNIVVGAGFFFALADRNQGFSRAEALSRTLVAVALFCAVSGVVYLFNDLHDAANDRLHPVKRHRPIASGRLLRGAALAECLAIGVISLCASFSLGGGFAAILASYLALQLCYTFALKRVPYVDTACIALGFVLRVCGGVVAARVALSPAIVLCSFFAALCIALGKRGGELAEAGWSLERAAAQRPVLRHYGVAPLRSAFLVSAVVALFGYSTWALLPSTAAKFGTGGMPATVPFVAAGIVRYVFLVVRRGAGARPEKLFFSDPVLVCALTLWLLSCAGAWLLA